MWRIEESPPFFLEVVLKLSPFSICQEVEVPIAVKGAKKGGSGKRRLSAVSQSSPASTPPHSTTLLPTSSPSLLPTPSPLLSAHTATATTTSLPGTTPVVKVSIQTAPFFFLWRQICKNIGRESELCVLKMFLTVKNRLREGVSVSPGPSRCEETGRLHHSLNSPAESLLRNPASPPRPPAEREHSYHQETQTRPPWRGRLPSSQC